MLVCKSCGNQMIGADPLVGTPTVCSCGSMEWAEVDPRPLSRGQLGLVFLIGLSVVLMVLESKAGMVPWTPIVTVWALVGLVYSSEGRRLKVFGQSLCGMYPTGMLTWWLATEAPGWGYVAIAAGIAAMFVVLSVTLESAGALRKTWSTIWNRPWWVLGVLLVLSGLLGELRGAVVWPLVGLLGMLGMVLGFTLGDTAGKLWKQRRPLSKGQWLWLGLSTWLVLSGIGHLLVEGPVPIPVLSLWAVSLLTTIVGFAVSFWKDVWGEIRKEPWLSVGGFTTAVALATGLVYVPLALFWAVVVITKIATFGSAWVLVDRGKPGWAAILTFVMMAPADYTSVWAWVPRIVVIGGGYVWYKRAQARRTAAAAEEEEAKAKAEQLELEAERRRAESRRDASERARENRAEGQIAGLRRAYNGVGPTLTQLASAYGGAGHRNSQAPTSEDSEWDRTAERIEERLRQSRDVETQGRNRGDVLLRRSTDAQLQDRLRRMSDAERRGMGAEAVALRAEVERRRPPYVTPAAPGVRLIEEKVYCPTAWERILRDNAE